MKYLILYFISLPAFATTCEQDVTRIRNTPARLISNSDYSKMLNGCPKNAPPEFISDADMEALKAKEQSASLEELNRFQAITAQQIQATDAALARMRAQQSDQVRGLAN